MVNLKKLSSVCEIKNGYAFKSSDYKDNGTPLLRISNLNDNQVFLDEEQIYVDNKFLKTKKDFIVTKGDVLIALSGATTGKYGIYNYDFPSLLNQRIGLVKADLSKDLDSSYFYFYLGVLKHDILRNAGGAAQPNISTSKIGELKIPLPPLETQKRIAQILDDAAALRDKTAQLLKEYDALAQSIFLDMFGDPVKNKYNFPIGKIRDLVKEAKYGTSEKASDVGQYPYLRMNNLTYEGFMDYSNLKYVDIPEKDLNKYLVKKGDLLFNRTNSKELVGKTSIFDSSEPMIAAGYLIRVRFNEKANPYFVSYYLNSQYGKLILKNMCKSIVGMANINAQEMQDIKILLPSIELQNQFAEKITLIEQQKELAKQELKESDDLFNCLLQKAFKGELV